MSTSIGGPSADTCTKLADNIMTHGFTTSTEPLLLCSGGEDVIRTRGAQHTLWGSTDQAIPALGLGIHKGLSRVATVHTICSLFIEDEVDMEATNPVLWHSLQNIHASDMRFQTLRDQTFHNFNIGCAGSIRKAPNVMTWASTIRSLCAQGDSDSGSILRSWNKQSARQFQVTGNRAQAIKNMIDVIGNDTRELLIAHVAKWGWDNCCFTEDGLACRQQYPGRHFRCTTSKQWTERLVVTSESCHNHFRRLIHDFEASPTQGRKKIKKDYLEESTELSACITNIANEVITNMPSALEDVKTEFLATFINGDPTIVLEVSSALAEKSNAFTYRHIPTIAKILDKQKVNRFFALLKV